MDYETKQIKGYKFNNLAAFNAAKALCNNHFNTPYNDEAITRDYIVPMESYKLNGANDFYYFKGDLSPVLGKNKEFTIRIEESKI